MSSNYYTAHGYGHNDSDSISYDMLVQKEKYIE